MRVLVLIATILITTHASAYERFMSPDQRFEAYTTAAAADGTRMKLFLRLAQTHDAGVLLWENARWTDAKWSPDSRFLAAVDHMDGHIADVYVFGVTAAHDESKIAPEEIGYDAFGRTRHTTLGIPSGTTSIARTCLPTVRHSRNVNPTGKMPVGPTAKMAVPRPESFSTKPAGFNRRLFPSLQRSSEKQRDD
jgi:hypothetical protein